MLWARRQLLEQQADFPDLPRSFPKCQILQYQYINSCFYPSCVKSIYRSEKQWIPWSHRINDLENIWLQVQDVSPSCNITEMGNSYLTDGDASGSTLTWRSSSIMSWNSNLDSSISGSPITETINPQTLILWTHFEDILQTTMRVPVWVLWS